MTSSLAPSGALDLSRLPPFSLVDADYESIRAARLAELQARLDAAGVVYDGLALESDPLVILQEEDAYREFLGRQAINDAARALSLAYAPIDVLEHIAATYYADIGLRRLEGEPIERFRRRIALAPEAASPYTPGAYVFAAVSSGLQVSDARALNHNTGLCDPGEVILAVLPAPGEDPNDVCVQVRGALNARSIQAWTDTVLVRPATVTTLTFAAVIEVPPGPEAALVRAEANARLDVYKAARRGIGRRVTRSGLSAALHVPAAVNVRLPDDLADIDPGPDGVVEFGPVELIVERTDG